MFDGAAAALDLFPRYAAALDSLFQTLPKIDRFGMDSDELVPRWQADPALLAIEGMTLLTVAPVLSGWAATERRITGDREGSIRATTIQLLVRVPLVAWALEAGGIVLPKPPTPTDPSSDLLIARAAFLGYVEQVRMAVQPYWSYWLRRWLHPSGNDDVRDLRRAVLRKTWDGWLKDHRDRIWSSAKPALLMLRATANVGSKGHPMRRIEAQWARLVRAHGNDEASAMAEILVATWQGGCDIFRADPDGKAAFDGSVLANALDRLVGRRRAKGNIDVISDVAKEGKANPLLAAEDLGDAVEQHRLARVRAELERLADLHGPPALALLAWKAGMGTKQECAARYGTSRGSVDHAERAWLPGALQKAAGLEGKGPGGISYAKRCFRPREGLKRGCPRRPHGGRHGRLKR